MKNILTILLYISLSPTLYAQFPVYNGMDLGLTYSKTSSSFRIWSPTAEQVQLLLYKDGTDGEPLQTIALAKGENGTWYTQLEGNRKGTFYAFRVRIGDIWNSAVPDPYAKATGVNGKRAMILDLKETDPPGWDKDKSPAFSKHNEPTDAVIYELHIRDMSMDSSSGIRHKGKFLGLTELGTTNGDGLLTGLSHLKQLGVTHVHLLPVFDFNSIDESKPDSLQYNWGYDPLNYNVPEGSYSTNPYDGVTRIKELKQLIEAFHSNGLRVIMDVVYNHTGVTEQSSFNQLVPGYYYRHQKDGRLSNATGCGNETASEMPMMRKFMLESLVYWEREYHMDGFRFDLMGVHDIETMNLISDSLHALKPDIILYGEGWTSGASPLPDSLRALKKNAYRLHHIAVFSDDIRDGIKGSVFNIKDRGFASGNTGMAESIKFGIVASCPHPQIDFGKVNYSHESYASAPYSVITYCECHDNNTLWDKLSLSCPGVAPDTLANMQRLALTIVLTSQGIPFLSEGTEFLRSKKGIGNSFNAGDSINAIHWEERGSNWALSEYIQRLIQIRKDHPAFRMTTQEQIAHNIRFDEQAPPGTIVYSINGSAVHDTWRMIWIAFNGNATGKVISLPPGKWLRVADTPEEKHFTPHESNRVWVGGFGAVILAKE